MTHIFQQLIKPIPEFSSNIRSKTVNLRDREGPSRLSQMAMRMLLDPPAALHFQEDICHASNIFVSSSLLENYYRNSCEMFAV
jgi:hypothetical protein